jgi:TatD family-associated radical SAM protein
VTIITYETGDGLYVNLTNRCSNSCDFCVRTKRDRGEKLSHGDLLYGDLWLRREPTLDEVNSDLARRDLTKYSELVFCGYGEPTERLDVLLAAAAEVKRRSAIPIRVNTNGHASLIAGHDVAPLFKDRVDVVSISLNTARASDYVRICHPVYGEAAFSGLIDFARRVKAYVPKVVMTVVRTTIPDSDLELCRQIANGAGAELRIREML